MLVLTRKLYKLFFLAALLFSAEVFAQPDIEMYQGAETAASQVLVKFKTTAARVNIENIKQSHDIDLDEGVGGLGVRKLRSRTMSVAALLHSLRARPDVEYAEPNYVVRTTAVPNDFFFVIQWGLQNTGQVIGGQGTPGADISATSAWDISIGSRATVVAVIDTGVDYTHPDLTANMWSAPAQFSVNIGGRIITCAAGTHGFNAITNSCDPMDDMGHGTHVAGTIGAAGNNSIGVTGVNWVASILAGKFLNAQTGTGLLSDAINAIEFAIQVKNQFGATANVRVLNNSWGCSGCFSQALLSEINQANAYDMLFVAAAGNNGTNNDITPFYPANHQAPNVVAVAATDNRDQLASFSNFGASTVHLGSPGVNIVSTVPNNLTGTRSGTSMATPHVSGAAALVLAGCTLNTAALKATLLNNTDPIAALSGKTVTGGRLNVNKAIRSGQWAGATLIETDNAGSAGSPNIAMDANGNAIAVWYQYDGVRYNIWANRYTAGSGWGAATLIETDNAGGATSPHIAMDANGNAIAVWYQLDGVRYNILANRYTAGSGWGAATLIETDNAGGAFDPQIAMDANDNAIAVWHQFDGMRCNIWANRYTASSGWGAATLIETDAGDAREPRIAMGATGNAIAVWSQSDGTRTNIWANRYTAGSGWGAATLIETNNAGYAFAQQIAMDANGNAIAVWQQSDGTRYNILANRFIRACQ